MFVINKINIDSSFNTLINIKMTTYIYDAQNNLNFDHCHKQQIPYIGL